MSVAKRPTYISEILGVSGVTDIHTSPRRRPPHLGPHGVWGKVVKCVFAVPERNPKGGPAGAPVGAHEGLPKNNQENRAPAGRARGKIKGSDAQARKNRKTLMLESATEHKHGALNNIQTQHIMITGICLDHGTQNK